LVRNAERKGEASGYAAAGNLRDRGADLDGKVVPPHFL
jgi:hypothetical protein